MARKLDDETLSRWLDGELDASERMEVDAAIVLGADDAARVARLRSQDERLKAWFAAENTDLPVLADAVRAGFAERRRTRRKAKMATWLAPVAAAAVVVIAGFAGFDYMLERRVESVLDQMRAERASDLALMASAVQDVLESRESGIEVSFHNPQTGLSFRIKPQRTWKSASGHWCREFVEIVGNGSETGTPVSTACRVAKQRWVRVVTTLPGGQEPALLDAATGRSL